VRCLGTALKKAAASRRTPKAPKIALGVAYAVARQLRALPQTSNALLVAVTGYGQAEDRALSREAGFDHHLLKPVEPSG
jgi:CheY-like chemotaxis protein